MIDVTARPSHELIAAIEDNLTAFRAHAASAAGATVTVEEDVVRYTSTARDSWANGVMRPAFTAHRMAGRADEVLRAMHTHGLPFMWWTGPAAPPGLDAHLLSRGMHLDITPVGMAADLSVKLAAPHCLPGVTVKRVQSEQDVEAWVQARRKSVGCPDDLAEYYRRKLCRHGFTESSALHSFVAYLQDRPVGASCVYVQADVAGLYLISVAPELRRQGIGTTLTHVAVQHAQSAGCALAVLTASPLGQSVYVSLGFRAYCEFRHYSWEPPACSASA